ncbi:hypothetical protein CHELA40_13708 [Chelatococcus asaccharovorans]|nr:hypothetical protein CHELA40_13708 [Chelatococcus asaccharovorans]CAH1676178.1 hypothetical protein CHELA17_61917 [Chelatococcus asaccharovorans]
MTTSSVATFALRSPGGRRAGVVGHAYEAPEAPPFRRQFFLGPNIHDLRAFYVEKLRIQPPSPPGMAGTSPGHDI